jgi:prophage regulatory protein
MKLIKLHQVKELTTLSKATIYRQIAKGNFPKQVPLGENASAWLEEEILDYLNQRIQSRV